MRKLFIAAIVVALSAPGAAWAGDDHGPTEAALIPGCPTTADGALSECLRRRAAWGAWLYEAGEVERLITSGSAVYNRYVEAEALAAALIAYGVPAENIFTETQALHTDENVAYGALLAEQIGVERLVMASDGMQVQGMMGIAGGFGIDARPAPMKIKAVRDRLQAPIPAIAIEPVPESTWMTVAEREQQIAAERGVQPRPPSFVRYMQLAMVPKVNGISRFKPIPPRTEPTPQRHLRPLPSTVSVLPASDRSEP